MKRVLQINLRFERRKVREEKTSFETPRASCGSDYFINTSQKLSLLNECLSV